MSTKGITPRKPDDDLPVLRVRSPSGKHIIEARGSLAIRALLYRDVIRWGGIILLTLAGGAAVVQAVVSKLPW